jgi:hypothetical protein
MKIRMIITEYNFVENFDLWEFSVMEVKFKQILCLDERTHTVRPAELKIYLDRDCVKSVDAAMQARDEFHLSLDTPNLALRGESDG